MPAGSSKIGVEDSPQISTMHFVRAIYIHTTLTACSVLRSVREPLVTPQHGNKSDKQSISKHPLEWVGMGKPPRGEHGHGLFRPGLQTGANQISAEGEKPFEHDPILTIPFSCDIISPRITP